MSRVNTVVAHYAVKSRGWGTLYEIFDSPNESKLQRAKITTNTFN